MYREEWLNKAVRLIEEKLFRNTAVMEHPRPMPEKWDISCGWSKGASATAIGVCVDPSCSKDGTTHLFIIPTLEDSFQVLSTITHEMIHAIVGIQEGHKGRFRETVHQLRMSSPMTSSHVVPETPAYEILTDILNTLGKYPHAAMVPKRKLSKPSAWIRWRSQKEPKYTILANTKQVIEFGLPRDPWGKEMMPIDPTRVFGAKKEDTDGE